MEKSQQSYYTLPFYKKVWYNIKNYILNKINEFKFPYAFVIFFALVFLTALTIVLVIQNNRIEIIARAPYDSSKNAGFFNQGEMYNALEDDEKANYKYKEHVLENKNYKFTLEERYTSFELFDKNNQTVYKSNPIEGKFDVFRLYFAANRGLEKKYDSYMKSVSAQMYKYKITDKSIELIYTVGNVGITKEQFPGKMNQTEFNGIMQMITDNEELTSKQKATFKATFQAAYRRSKDKDENGEYIYNRNISDGTVAAQEVYEIYYNICKFTKEDVDNLNAKYGIVEELLTQKFDVGIRYTLHEDRLQVEVINDAFTESKDAPLIGLELLPYFNAGNDKNDGYIIIPDGSGVKINFNNNKLNATPYNKRIYGSDNGIKQNYLKEQTENITMPLYGIKNDDKTLLSVVSQGAEMTNILAKSASATDKENTASFKFYLREGLDYVFNGWNNDQYVTGWTKSYIKEDFIVNYYFLEPGADYVDMAKKAREILLDDLDDIQNKLSLNLNILGAYTRDESILGFPVTTVDSLTSYSEVETILNSFNTIENIHVNYEGMFNDGLDHYALEKIKINKVMGNKDSLNKLLSKYNNIYSSINLGSVYTDEKFDEKKYAVRDPFSDIVKHYRFDSATLVPLADATPLYTIKGSLLKTYNENVVAELLENGVKSINVLDLGRTISGSYRNKDTEFRDSTLAQYKEILKLYVDNGISLSAYAPSLYMLEDGYITNISGVATDGTKYNVVDASIPFYQLVLSGKVNYSSKAINLEDVYSLDYHKLKAIETGSNLNFTLSHDKTDKLIKTDFNHYYNTYYGYYSEKINDLYNELNQIGYASANLIDHEILANDIVKVTYSNGVSIILNYSHQEYNGISPLGYKVE